MNDHALRHEPPVPPGSRSENLLMALTLACDLAVTPLHLLVFLFTRGRQKRRLMAAIEAAAQAPAADAASASAAPSTAVPSTVATAPAADPSPPRT